MPPRPQPALVENDSPWCLAFRQPTLRAGVAFARSGARVWRRAHTITPLASRSAPPSAMQAPACAGHDPYLFVCGVIMIFRGGLSTPRVDSSERAECVPAGLSRDDRVGADHGPIRSQRHAVTQAIGTRRKRADKAAKGVILDELRDHRMAPQPRPQSTGRGAGARGREADAQDRRPEGRRGHRGGAAVVLGGARRTDREAAGAEVPPGSWRHPGRHVRAQGWPRGLSELGGPAHTCSRTGRPVGAPGAEQGLRRGSPFERVAGNGRDELAGVLLAGVVEDFVRRAALDHSARAHDVDLVRD